jgi:hypothetical protein
MKTVSFRSVRDSVCYLMGVDPEELQANLAASMTDAINRSVRRGWETDAWWPWRYEEERRYRQTWDVATSYGIGDEVWYEAGEQYYKALLASVGIVPGTDGTIWEEIDTPQVIRFVEPTMPEIGRLVGVYDGRGIPVDYMLMAEGAFVVAPVPDPVRVQYSAVRPVFSSRVWDVTANYAKRAGVLRGDECYLASVANVGLDPETNLGTWVLQGMPDILADFVAQDAYATMLETDMQTERSMVARAQAKDLLEAELDKVFFQQQQTRRFRVIR